MLIKPNDLPPIVLGESRRVEFRLSGAVGANTINSFEIEASPANVTFGTPSINGSNVTVLVTPGALGSYEMTATANLSSNEIVKGLVRVKVIEARNRGSSCDYRDN